MIASLLWQIILWLAGASVAILAFLSSYEYQGPRKSRRLLQNGSRELILNILSLHNFKFELKFCQIIFGEKILSFKRVFASIIFSVLWFIITCLLYQIFLPSANYQAFMAIRFYDDRMALGAVLLFISTIVIDMISIHKTLFLIKVANGNGRYRILAIVADLVVTPAMFLVLFSAFYSVVFLILANRGGMNFHQSLVTETSCIQMTGVLDYMGVAFKHSIYEDIASVFTFFMNVVSGNMQATFVRIPVPLSDGELVSYIHFGGRYPVAAYAYPFMHYFISSFFIIVWALTLLCGKAIAGIIRFMSLKIKSIYWRLGDVASREHPATFLAAVISLYLISALLISYATLEFIYLLEKIPKNI
ncbi:hypothetical protein [Nitrospirillum pindoramense]|uniref:Uncharacterized protein n=1 Tax=Nitrospirillum amazonense TaxID=28077 RepID=A0A560HJP4_9PROT|nr:hypothetical protein [Nitrospirillum amazonense]TWB45759.1 hypothetical protein FBZ90_10192 [Nitrospirillum amazonense]